MRSVEQLDLLFGEGEEGGNWLYKSKQTPQLPCVLRSKQSQIQVCVRSF